MDIGNPSYEKLKETLEILQKENRSLKEERNQYFELFNQNLSSSVVANLDGNIIETNPQLQTLLQYTKDEFKRLNIFDVVAQKDNSPKLAKERFRKLINDGFIEFEGSFIKKNGSEFFGRIKASIISLKNSQFILGNIEDIGLHNKINKELLNKKEQFELIMKATNDGFYDWNLITNEIYYSPRWKEMLGYKDNELPNEFSTWEELTHPDDVPKCWKILKEHINGTRDRFEAEFKMRCKNGKWMSILSRANAIFNTEGKAIRVIGTHINITNQKEIVKALKKSESTFKNTIDSSPFGIYIYRLEEDNSLIFENANPAADKILGIDNSKFIGKTIEEAFLPLKETELPEKYRRAALYGELYHTEQIDYDYEGIVGAFDVTAFQIADRRVAVFFQNIASRKQAEEELKNSEERYRSTINAMDTYIHVVDKNYRLTLYNKAFENKVRELKINEELIGKNIFELFSFLTEKNLNEYKTVLEHGNTIVTEEITKFQNKSVWSETRKIPIKNKKGNITRIVTLIQDNTDRKKSEEELKNSQKQLSIALTGSNSGIWDWDIANNHMFFDANFFTMAGYKPDEFPHSYDEWKKRVHPDDIEDTEDQINAYLSGETDDYKAEFRLKQKNNRWMWILSRGRAFEYDKNGRPVRFTGTHTDITQRKMAEQALIKEIKRVDNILQGTNAGTWDWNIQTNEVYYNKRWAEIIGYDIDEIEMCFKTWVDTVHSEDYKIVNNELQENFKKEKDYYDVEFRQKHKNGKWVWVNARGQVVEWSKEGKPLRMSGTHIDITPRKKIELELKNKNKEYQAINEELTESLERIQKMNSELERAREKAIESDRLKTAFLANMSHEIRTPMNGILGFTGLLREPELNDLKKEHYINIIEKSGNRMLNIINDLIDISKIEAGQVEISTEDFNINELNQYLFNFFKPEAERKGLQLIVSNELPDDKAILTSDKDKIHAINSNLIKNAIKYTHAGNIEFGYRKKNNSIEFFFRDTGIGIEKSRQKAVFDRFVQADLSVSKPYEGAGLGLSITKAFVEILGGKIWLDSEINVGSTFSYSIPILESDQKNSDSPILLNNKRTSPINNLTILIAEDDEIGIQYLDELLDDRCKKIVHALNGIEAINFCHQLPEIDLILMDIKMPEMDGLTATKEIKKFRPNLPIIAQTAYAMKSDMEKLLIAGCDSYLSKPIKEEELFQVIEQVIQK